MCGFTGWFQARGQIDTDRRRQFTAALDLITHRGPDDGVEVSGDTWWMGLTQRLRWPEDFQSLAADRVRKGFSVVQIVNQV